MSNFSGFSKPSQNYSKLPHALIECLPIIETVAELKVVIYLLRHTWGYSEYDKPKKITTDEFMNGRKKKDGSRMDKGTGLSNNSVITGLEKAVEHGFIVVEVDDSDKARIEKHYRLNMSDMQSLHIGDQTLHSECADIAQRTEKETKVRNPKKAGVKLTKEEVDQANAKVDAILANDKKAKYEHRDSFPETLAPYADAYVELTGQKPTKRVLMDWLQTFSDWLAEGLSPDNIRMAWEYASREGGFLVSRPGSLTNTAVALKSRRSSQHDTVRLL